MKNLRDKANKNKYAETSSKSIKREVLLSRRVFLTVAERGSAMEIKSGKGDIPMCGGAAGKTIS